MKDTMIGVDLAKSVFVLHGASVLGEVKFRKKLSRSQFLKFIADQAPAVVVMEACGSAHYWARQVVEFGHEVKLIAPQICPAVREAAEKRCGRRRGDRDRSAAAGDALRGTQVAMAASQGGAVPGP